MVCSSEGDVMAMFKERTCLYLNVHAHASSSDLHLDDARAEPPETWGSLPFHSGTGTTTTSDLGDEIVYDFSLTRARQQQTLSNNILYQIPPY